MSNNALVATPDDYVKFKKFLHFFVQQAKKNASNGKAEEPTKNKIESKNSPPKDNPLFTEHYKREHGLEPGFNVIAGVDFIIRFFLNGHFNTERTTYINRRLFNIVGKFNIVEGYKKEIITALRNLIRLDIQSFSIIGDLRKLCEERNKTFQFNSVEALELNNDAPPNDLLKNMLDEYLEAYNKFHKEIELAEFIFKQNNPLSFTIQIDNDDISDDALEKACSALSNEFSEFTENNPNYKYKRTDVALVVKEIRKGCTEIEYILNIVTGIGINIVYKMISDFIYHIKNNPLSESVKTFFRAIKNEDIKFFNIVIGDNNTIININNNNSINTTYVKNPKNCSISKMGEK